MEPEFRCGTKKAITELADDLQLKYGPHMQDWSYEVANSTNIEKYISFYKLVADEDKKFVLLEIIFQALIDQPNENEFTFYWKKIEPILIKDFKIHEYTIHYWKNLNESNFDNCKFLSPLLKILELNIKMRHNNDR